MQIPDDAVLSVIRQNDFTRETLSRARELLYVFGKDWSKIRRDGNPVWEDENFGIVYHALGVLLGENAAPALDGAKVNVGGLLFPANALLQLENSFKDHSSCASFV